MKFRQIVFIYLLLSICTGALAQTEEVHNSGIHFAVQAGASLQTLNGKDYWGEVLNNNLTPGFSGGVNVIIPFLPDLYVNPGVLIVTKGAKQDIIIDNITKDINLTYLEIPLEILFRPQAGNGHILIGMGPYGAIGIAGNEKTKSGSTTTTLKVKFLSDAAEESTAFVYYRAFDTGLNLKLGYEFYNKIYCQANGQFGLHKINADYELPNDKTSKKNIGFGVSAGYRF